MNTPTSFHRLLLSLISNGGLPGSLKWEFSSSSHLEDHLWTWAFSSTPAPHGVLASLSRVDGLVFSLLHIGRSQVETSPGSRLWQSKFSLASLPRLISTIAHFSSTQTIRALLVLWTRAVALTFISIFQSAAPLPPSPPFLSSHSSSMSHLPKTQLTLSHAERQVPPF